MSRFTEHMEDHYLFQMNESFSLNPFKHMSDFLNKDIHLGEPQDEIRTKSLHVTRLSDHDHLKHKMSGDFTNKGIIFEPTHEIHTHGDHFIVGKVAGKEGHQVYKVNHNGTGNRLTYTHADSFKLLHQHPELTLSHIGRKMYKDNKEAFKVLPLTASKAKVNAVMHLDPEQHTGGVLNHTIMNIAVGHYNASKDTIGAMLSSPHLKRHENIITTNPNNHNIHPKYTFAAPLLRAATIHGLERNHASLINNVTHLMNDASHPQIATIVANRLSQP